jgi:hypothetical protein
MKSKEVDVIIKIAACVCGKDGVISQSEEKKMYEIISAFIPDYSIEDFDKVLDSFFEENTQIEEYLEILRESNRKSFCISLCEQSASADGLDIKENIALHKVKSILEIDL